MHTACAYCLIGKEDNYSIRTHFIFNTIGQKLTVQIVLLKNNKKTQVASILA